MWTATAAVAPAYDIERRFCGAEAFHADVSPPPVVLGCRLAGCCDGCNTEAALDLAVDVEGDFPVTLRARIEGDSAPRVQLAPGRTVIKAVVEAVTHSAARGPAASARPRLLRVEASLDAGAVERAARAVPARRFNAGAAARLAITFTQLQGERVVAIDRYAATAAACSIQKPLTDRIELAGNDGGEEAVVIVRGARDGACVSGEVWTGKRLIYIGNLASVDGCPADVAVFSRDHAAVLRSIGGLSPAGSSAPAAQAPAATAPGARGEGAAPPRIVVGQRVGLQGWTAGVGESLAVSLAPARVVLPLAVRLIAPDGEVEALRERFRFDLEVADRALNLSRCG
ncbi:MAG: hypothetical protein HY899_05965, partial [Deltaproteobacteria bacterium]|nr:hypothetical protein [Deltaproteobacteria bacterium]